MRNFVILMLVASMTLSACGGFRESRLNPGNWFGKSRSIQVSAPSDAVAEPTEVNPLIPTGRNSIFRRDKSEKYLGTPIDDIVALRVERLPTGAIVHATGVAFLQGAYDVRLTSNTDGKPVDGVLTFTMEAIQPLDQPQGTVRSRTIEVARFVSNDVLNATRTIQVVGGRNARSSGR